MYTKGEWKVGQHGEIMVGEYQVGCVSWGRPDSKANTHLISAAPDMYEALKLLQAALTEYGLRDIKKRYSLCVADSIASKALAKAEGK